MTYRTAADILEEARQRGMRKAFFITALLLEMEAVRAHLTDLGSVKGRDGTIFECCVFEDLGQEWLVVVAETGAGTHPAQNVASQAHNLFNDFEIQVLVGVGGSRKPDAPIGTVVASDKVYMPYSGKAGQTGFSHRPTSFPLDGRLVALARKVRRDKSWPSRIRPPIDGRLPPLDSYPVGYPPIGLVAPIASIEAVLDDPDSDLEALLAHGYSDTCVVEMEGYGAVYAASAERTPSIIIRGVSDMTEGKSAEDDAMLQPIAACHAAAFAFELLSHWGELYEAPPGTLDGGKKALVEGTPMPSGVIDDGSLDSSAMEGGSASIKGHISWVMNVSAPFGPEDKDRIERFQSLLRKIAADEQIEIVDATAGSLRLFISDPNQALSKLTRDKLREGVAELENVEVLGLVSGADFELRERTAVALATASSELLAWPTTLPDGAYLERPELSEVRERIDQQVSSTTAILGAPGAGKSALLAKLGSEYIARGWPVLAIKADLLETEINTEAALRDRLGLDDLPSALIEGLSEFGPVLLLIDQLDALAGYLDVRTGRLSTMLNIIRKLSGTPNVHIVLSSRLFEFQHDARLKSVSAESVTLQLPPWSEVLAALEERGILAAGWPADAQEEMRSPQALAIYLQLNTRHSSEPFRSYQAMLDQLWSERILVGDRGQARDQLASDIADCMAEEESLWLARARFDDRLDELNALEGAGVLAKSDGSVGFSHQTLFEFTLARSFARERGRLSRFVLERQTSLFVRPKLWAGLTYLRATEVDSYHSEVEAIWATKNLRAHLSLLLVEFLGSQAEPTDREALLMEKALTGESTKLRAFRALTGSKGWFKRFAHSFVADAMTASDSTADAQIDVLSRALDFEPDQVAQLIKERWLPKPDNDSRAWLVIQSASNWTDAVLEIASTIVRRTPIAPMFVDNVVATIGVAQPNFAAQLARARLDAELEKANAEAALRSERARPEENDPNKQLEWMLRDDPREPIKQLIDRSTEWDSLPALSEQSPQIFLETLWPWYVSAFEAIAKATREHALYVGYPIPLDADFRFEGETDLDLPEPTLLNALRVAVERIASEKPDEFTAWVAENERVELTPVQRIIAHGIQHEPERYASLGLDFLLGDVRRFYLGSIHDLRSTTKALVTAISPFWTSEQNERFELAVRAYQPIPPATMTDPKDRMNWRHSSRRTQLDLLRSLPSHQMSAASRRQVLEDERRYGTRHLGVTFSGAQWIGPVLDSDAMEKATDADIVNAFKELPDATGWDHPRNWMTGGNIQLARAFASFAKANRDRAAIILGKLDKDNGTRAAGYAIDAVSEDAPPEFVHSLLRDVVSRGFDGAEFRQSVARAIERLANRKLTVDDDAIELLETWLKKPVEPEPESEEADHRSGEDDDEDSGDKNSGTDENDPVQRSFLWGYGGFGVLPGGDYPVAEALLHLRLVRQEHDQALTFLNAYLDREHGVKVWGSLTRFFPYLSKADEEARKALFRRLYSEVPKYIETSAGAQLLASSRIRDPELVNQFIDHLREAKSRPARQAYGEIVGLIALQQTDLNWAGQRLEEIVERDDLRHARAGIALSAANVFADGENKVAAAELLARLLSRNEPGVWGALFDIFRMVDSLTPDGATTILLSEIAKRISDAPQVNATFLVDRLGTLLPHKAALVGQVAFALVEQWKLELADVRTVTAMAAGQLVDLAITLHRLGPETRDIGTKLFERLIETNAYEARQMLDEIDNRFRGSAPLARRRLPRRDRSRRRTTAR